MPLLQRMQKCVAQEAVETVRRWGFKPATCDGVPIASQINASETLRGCTERMAYIPWHSLNTARNFRCTVGWLLVTRMLFKSGPGATTMSTSISTMKGTPEFGLFLNYAFEEDDMAHGIIWWIVVGLIAGWAAGKIMKGGGYGVIADILLGIVGGIVGGWVVSLLGFGSGGMIWSILVAILGAVILIWLTRLIKKEV